MADLKSVDDFLDRIHAEHVARGAIRLAEMKVAGLEPCPGTGIVSIGMELFGMCLRPVGDGKVEVRLNVVDDMPWGKPWPDRGALFEAVDVLDAIRGAWPVVGHGYTKGPGGGEATIAPSPIRGEAVPLTLTEDAGQLVAVVDGTRVRFGRESVLVAQVLMTAADALARMLPEAAPAATAWAAVRGGIDLPPFAADGDAAPDTLQEETAWFAAKAGLPLSTYRLAALDVLARQVVSSQDREKAEPRSNEWHPRHVPDALDAPATLELCAYAASICGMSEDDFEEQALTTRNNEAFQRIFYGDGLGPGR